MEPFYLGIDVSKGYADFMIINSKKHLAVQGFQLDDTFDGHRSLYNFLGRFLDEHPDSTLFAGMENTGGYENNWLLFLGYTRSIKPAEMVPAAAK